MTTGPIKDIKVFLETIQESILEIFEEELDKQLESKQKTKKLIESYKVQKQKLKECRDQMAFMVFDSDSPVSDIIKALSIKDLLITHNQFALDPTKVKDKLANMGILSPKKQHEVYKALEKNLIDDQKKDQ